MWTIKRSHQHIKSETMSEYLDDRLQGGALARVDQQLASCRVCREELESLRATVTMLQDLPVDAPQRSFTMAAPPAEPVPARSSPLLRAPQWVYAGAASVAAIVLVILVSADATGLLAPDKPDDVIAVEATKSVQVEAGVIEDGTEGRDQAKPPPAAAAPVAEESAVEDSLPSVAMAAEAEPMREPAVPIAKDDLESEIQASGDTPDPGIRTTRPEERTRIDGRQDEEQVPIAGASPKEMPANQKETTATFWRVLEGLAGAIGLVFLAGLTLRWKISRRTRRV